MDEPTLTFVRVFIIEGVITIGVSVLSWFFIVPFPEHCTFLKQEEKQLLLARTKADGGDVSLDEISYRSVLIHLKDWKIWAGVLMNVGVQENANSIANFQPTVIRGLGKGKALRKERHTNCATTMGRIHCHTGPSLHYPGILHRSRILVGFRISKRLSPATLLLLSPWMDRTCIWSDCRDCIP